ncbi:LysR substrate-binding domain-containing protein, partial [Klebsiella pneumoniae]|nr:LysR substrate-binding domain-containing protein [Klebsiella pneumoniae]
QRLGCQKACVLPENPASYRVVRTKSYLFNKAYPYIYFSENSGLRPFIDNVFMQQKLVPEIACYVDEDTAMAGLVSIDYGIAIMPRITALSYYNVHILKIKNTIPPRYIYLATMKDKGLSPALESFKNVVIHDSQKIC